MDRFRQEHTGNIMEWRWRKRYVSRWLDHTVSGEVRMAGEQSSEEKIYEVMMPYALAEQNRVQDAGIKFVHYTSAENALKILKSKCLWMRNASCMNDYNEMRHGLRCLMEAFRTESGATFNAALNACHGGLAEEVDQKFSAVAPDLIEHTYVTCVSEHSGDEELYGRLSMWRAYGSATGVALVFNTGPFLRPTNAIPAWVTPVAYIDTPGFQGQIGQVAQNIIANRDLLSKFDRAELLEIVFRSLIAAVVSSKHKGFREEKEWRIVHCPTLWASNDERMPLDHVAIGGIPQPIFKIPFIDYKEEGFYGATIPDLIDDIIVGPTAYPSAIRTTFAQILGKCGMESPLDKVHCSDVSLRV